MLQARDERLRPIAAEFERALIELPVGSADETELKSGNERLAEIKRGYELVREDYPTWPIRTRLLRGLIAGAVLPYFATADPAIGYDATRIAQGGDRGWIWS